MDPMQTQAAMILFAGLALGIMWYVPNILLAIWYLLQ